ncbi:MAG: stage 0 sporulation family protein [Oscillospiraceae bacterium]|nr:stage 0 sporulation family protein [Oscillospiraceae bacterium]
MIEVVSIKFKNRGKAYSFDPRGLTIRAGDKLVVETAKGLELADCCHGNHTVENSAVVLPLRPVIRLATQDDLRVAEINVRREAEAVEICKQKIAEHGLDMKLVDAECSFEGNKITFFFTSDGRVDFRELVKDLAGIFRTRIELRQIGVRDEAKMVGGIAICGRPYCCGQFLEDFQPVSTKMAKIQSLSLNPAKISGSCGRLMCCLRYEQEAYEELIRNVPKQGAFVETKDGYGTAVQVNLLRQCVKVRLDGDNDDTLHLYKSNELAAVPGGRPKDGEEPPHVLHYVPEPEEPEEKEDEWTLPVLYADQTEEPSVPEKTGEEDAGAKKRSRRGGRSKARPAPEARSADKQSRQENRARSAEKTEKPEEKAAKAAEKPAVKPAHKRGRGGKKKEEASKTEAAPKQEAVKTQNRGHVGKTVVKPVKLETKSQPAAEPAAPQKPEGEKRRRHRGGRRKPGAGENKT